jgi:hypothetical protein
MFRRLFILAIVLISTFIPTAAHAQNLTIDRFPGENINVLNLPGASQIFGTCTTTKINPSVPGYISESMSWQFRCFSSSNSSDVGIPTGDAFKKTYSHPFWGAMY